MRTLILILSLLCGGCATTTMTVGPDEVVEWRSKTLWKDVKDAHVVWGSFEATLGSSVGNGGESVMMNNIIACYLSPDLCKQP